MYQKLLLTSVVLLAGLSATAQVGIGTDSPNASTQLQVVANNKGILLPQVPLTSTTDAVTITNGNVESLLVYNTNTINDITPGYYYWYQGKWKRVIGSGEATPSSSNTILNGNTAPTLITGNVGDLYLDTNTNLLYGPKTASGWGTGVPLNGTNGNTVLNGTVAPIATNGKDGDFFLDTATNTLYGPKVAGAWPTTGTPLNGKDGKDGKSVLNGSGTPAAGNGVDGDFFLDTATNTLYGPKVAGAWPTTGAPLNGTNGNTVLNGTAAPIATNGNDGDFFLDTATNTLYGPKVGTTWPTTGTPLNGTNGIDGIDGKSVINGTAAPTNQGKDGDFFLDTATNTLYGPKVGTTWPTTGTPLNGTNGIDGIDGKSVLNGTTAPTTQGKDGDFFLDTATNTLYGPKVAGAWPTTGTPLNGTNGVDGKSVLNGTAVPLAANGKDGEFFLNTTTNTLYGPKVSGAWPTTGTPLNGTNGTNGIDGKSVLNGTAAPLAANGKDGDFFLNTTTNTLYGPKVSGAWPTTGTPLNGKDGGIGLISNGTNTTVTGDGTVTTPYVINTKEGNGLVQNATTGALEVNANNGITVNTANDLVQLGGALVKPTTITAGATNTLAIAGLTKGSSTDNMVVADPTTGVLKQVKATPRFFYMPAVVFDTATTGTALTRDLFTEYKNQFEGNALSIAHGNAGYSMPYTGGLVGSTGAPADIATYASGELYYYVSYYDTAVFSNLSISADGKLTYTILAGASEVSYMNIVFVVKE